MAEETRVRFECRQVGAIHIEGLDFVAVRSPAFEVSFVMNNGGRGLNVHAEDRSVFVNTQGSKSVLGGVYGGDGVVHAEIPQANFTVAAT